MGLLASAALAASTLTEVYACPTGYDSSFNVKMCNRGTSACYVRLAVTTGAVPTDGNYIEYDYSLPASGVLENTAIALASGQKLYAWASAATVSVNVIGVATAV